MSGFPLDTAARVCIRIDDISYFNFMHINTIINGSPERLKYHFIYYYYFIVIINIIQSDRFQCDILFYYILLSYRTTSKRNHICRVKCRAGELQLVAAPVKLAAEGGFNPRERPPLR